ncbi:MAG: hypothetical protein J5887_06940 [Erysipelotrichaceae bacterium]|nr:hypothetical protein [Erysipelotrichaceae bacterium]
MKKLITVILVLLLTGCMSDVTREIDKERYDAYMTYYQSILEEEDKLSKSQSYDTELVVNALEDGTYRYDVIIDNPRVAMYQIRALAVIDDLSGKIDPENMMPSIGILDDAVYNMMPNVVNKDKGFVAGVTLSLVSDQPQLRIGLMVEYVDSSKVTSKREYITLFASYK